MTFYLFSYWQTEIASIFCHCTGHFHKHIVHELGLHLISLGYEYPEWVAPFLRGWVRQRYICLISSVRSPGWLDLPKLPSAAQEHFWFSIWHHPSLQCFSVNWYIFLFQFALIIDSNNIFEHIFMWLFITIIFFTTIH